ncbi:MAG: HAMP domain-containing protein [Steroidobacteraceae bacterium]
MMRSSAVSLALGYVALGIAALVLFAAPLWYAWQVTIQDGRSEILQADAQRLTDVYRRDGGDALKSFIDARVNMQIAGDRILLLTNSSLQPLAGNLSLWPRNLPATPGDYRIKVDVGDKGTQQTLVHVAHLGDYYLLVGRDNKLFAPLERRFWYGLTAAIAVLSIAGLLVGLITRRALMSRVHSIRRTVSAIIHGDLKHRLPTHLSGDELNTLARTINGMLDQIELLVHGVRNVSNSIAHAHSARRAALSAGRTRADAALAGNDICGDRRRRRGRRSRHPHFRCVAAPRGDRCRHAPLGIRAV